VIADTMALSDAPGGTLNPNGAADD